jgi:GTP-binding protein HflX
LVGVTLKRKRPLLDPQDSLDELAELARTAGATEVGRVAQRLDRPSNTYLGKGKLRELDETCRRLEVDTVICDDELTPTQQRNLEDQLGGRKVLDRTALILDVFASRARTREGRLQVELAQHEYLLPRLAGQWTHLERLGGGIGTRGPGETQIETDRRLVRDRLQKLKSEIQGVRRHRKLHRSKRAANQIPVLSLVGYTNAGKSTLLNRITHAKVRAENLMFSTLDPVTRRIQLPSGRPALLTDTVGFIHKLPTSLVAAFRATLEEIEESSLILHVVDSTHRNAPEQVSVVESILEDLGLNDVPVIAALNKSDLNSESESRWGGHSVDYLKTMSSGAADWVRVSALTGDGVDLLLERADMMLTSEDTNAVPVGA